MTCMRVLPKSFAGFLCLSNLKLHFRILNYSKASLRRKS